MIPTLSLILPLFADSSASDNIITSVITSLGGAGFGVAIAWYMLTKWSPKVEADHRLQLAEQRTDLLNLAATERALAERIVQIFATSQGITIADNQKGINEIKEAIAHTRQAANSILDAMRGDGRVAEELQKSREELERLRAKAAEWGSDGRRHPPGWKPGEPDPKPKT